MTAPHSGEDPPSVHKPESAAGLPVSRRMNPDVGEDAGPDHAADDDEVPGPVAELAGFGRLIRVAGRPRCDSATPTLSVLRLLVAISCG